jgi:hypothetical protein
LHKHLAPSANHIPAVRTCEHRLHTGRENADTNVSADPTKNEPDVGLGRELQFDGLGAFAALIRFRFKGDARPLVKRSNAGLFNRCDMDKNVLATLVRGNKPETLSLVEKFYSARLPHAMLLKPQYTLLFCRQNADKRTVGSPARLTNYTKVS